MKAVVPSDGIRAAVMSDLCPICCEAANATGRKPVACQFCHYAACAACVRQYLLSRPDEPQCMSCHAIWDDEALERGLPKSFIDGAYKDHRKQVMFDREKARLPEAMERAKAERGMREALATKEILQKQIDALMLQVTDMRNRMETTVAAAEWHKRRAEHGGGVGGGARKPRFVHHCPAPNCRGFLEPERHACGVCAIRCCGKCIKPVSNADCADGGDAHVCNAEDIETVKLLKSTSRSCPNCAVPIFKIDGCDQMYCTACHTAFSWTTGDVEKGRVHNPHYYEFMRRNGGAPREVGDVVCGGFPQDNAFVRWMAPFFGGGATDTYEVRHKLMMCMRVFVHTEDVMLRTYRAQPPDADINMDLRIKYLLGDYSDAEMKRELAKRAKAANKKQAIRLVLEMLVAAAGDVARGHLATTPATAEAMAAMLSEFDVLRLFANQALARISKTYGAVVPVFVERWTNPEMRKA